MKLDRIDLPGAKTSWRRNLHLRDFSSEAYSLQAVASSVAQLLARGSGPLFQAQRHVVL